jgi:hypothetical protein
MNREYQINYVIEDKERSLIRTQLLMQAIDDNLIVQFYRKSIAIGATSLTNCNTIKIFIRTKGSCGSTKTVIEASVALTGDIFEIMNYAIASKSEKI